MGLYHTKQLLYSKGNHQQIQRHPTERENMFTDTSDKGLISKIYEELIKLNTSPQKTTQTIQFKKWAKDLNKHFSKVEIQMANSYKKICSMLLIIR